MRFKGGFLSFFIACLIEQLTVLLPHKVHVTCTMYYAVQAQSPGPFPLYME